jgi:hypothetical protein
MISTIQDIESPRLRFKASQGLSSVDLTNAKKRVLSKDKYVPTFAGRKHSAQSKLKIRQSVPSGKNSVHWKDNDLSYAHLHEKVGKLLKKPSNKKCPICSKVTKRLELCNISKETNVRKRYDARDPIIMLTYNLNIKNWYYACNKCHKISDGRLDKATQTLNNFVKTFGPANKGNTLSDEQKLKQSQRYIELGVNKGKKNPFYAKHHTPESIEKISTTQKKRLKIKENNSRYGTHLLPETRKQISKTLTGEKLTDIHKTNISEGLKRVRKLKFWNSKRANRGRT